jgi:hypothetical protein
MHCQHCWQICMYLLTLCVPQCSSINIAEPSFGKSQPSARACCQSCNPNVKVYTYYDKGVGHTNRRSNYVLAALLCSERFFMRFVGWRPQVGLSSVHYCQVAPCAWRNWPSLEVSAAAAGLAHPQPTCLRISVQLPVTFCCVERYLSQTWSCSVCFEKNLCL